MAATMLELGACGAQGAQLGGREQQKVSRAQPLGCLPVAREGLTEFSCPHASRWTAPNCLGFQLPSCLKARPYLVI